MKQGKWEMYTRGTIYLHRFAMALKAIEQDTAKQNLLAPISELFYINVGSKLWFAWNYKEIHNYGQKILNISQSPKKFKKHYNFLNDQCKLANAAAEKIRGATLEKVSNKKLIQLYSELYAITGKIQIILGAEIDAVDLVFDNFLQSELKKELWEHSLEKINRVYKNISAPVHTTYVTRQHIDTLKASLGPKDIKAAACNLEKKYWWTILGWENVLPHTEKYFINQITKLQKSKNIPSQILALTTQENKVKLQRGREVKKYHLTKQFQHLLMVLDQYTAMHDLRKEMQVKNVYAFHLLLKESARRLKLKPNDLEWAWYEEIQKLLAGTAFNRKEMALRKQTFGVVITTHRLKFYSGAIAIKELTKVIKADSKINQTEVKGLGVTQGIVQGTVKVCSGYQEALKKVKAGDILVTGMTLPDYISAMRKAAAIVTDEGGITCHAAIVSRELGKVCVVGTKIATEVFRDGDLVEVDANKGTVKKI